MHYHADYDRFYDILVYHNALDKFLENTKHRYGTNSTRDPIDTYMTWSNTPEGHEYWGNINKNSQLKQEISLDIFRLYAVDRAHAETAITPYEFW